MTERADGRRVGEIVGGKYRVVRLLASGGMGVVYEAQHTLVRRRFAVKFLRPHLVEQRESLARFQREAQAAGALESENLTAAVDFGIGSDGSPYIVMEYLVGESLQSLLVREGRLPVERAADLVVQACRGIHAAHASGIIHRDLKPQNLFVCRREDGTDLLKVLDFGIAKLELLDKGNTATRTGAVLGTPAYMSPEQARGEKSIDHGADIYALGAILYELLCGEKPHPGSSHNAILHHIATQPAAPLASGGRALPAALVAIVTQSLASQPELRPGSADALALALAPFARREVWPAARAEDSVPEHAAPESGASSVASPGRSRRSANLVAWGAGGILVLALILLATVDREVPTRAVNTPEPPREVVLEGAPPAPAPAELPVSAPVTRAGATAESAVAAPELRVRQPPAAELSAARKPESGGRAASPATPSAAQPRTAKRAESGAPPAPDTVTQVPLGASRSVPVTFDQSNPYR